ncbi:hypothetical protein [Halobaculum sp. EA56]|uniref:hypothetical protein n=1 Tax=Halobaculum sp. EA56 TaxID=3421648 RepID=UPI003EBD63C1
MTRSSENTQDQLPSHSPLLAVTEDERVRERMNELREDNEYDTPIEPFNEAIEDVFFDE